MFYKLFFIYILNIIIVFFCHCLGASFIIKKKALVQISLGSGRRAANGGYGYLTNWLWWFGLSMSMTFVILIYI